jgi:hypothetical protein
MPNLISQATVTDQQIVQAVTKAVQVTNNLRSAKNVQDVVRIVQLLNNARRDLIDLSKAAGKNNVK